MFLGLGVGAYTGAVFHVMTHAFFKAILFLSAGSVIQGVERGHHHVEHHPHLKKQLKSQAHGFDPQDMRNMGGIRGRMKITFWVYLIGALALSGIPPLAGFFSKDEILLEASLINPAVYYLLLGAAFFTAFYMGRQVLMVFFGEARSEAPAHASESRPLMTVPLMILAFLSAFGGLLNLPLIHTFGHWLEHTIKIEEAVKEVTLGQEAAQAISGFDPLVAAISTVLALLAFALAWYIYVRRYKETLRLPRGKRPDDPLRPMLGPVFKLLKNKYWVDERTGRSFSTHTFYALLHGICRVTGASTAGVSGAFAGWLSDDEASVPVRAELQVILGSIMLELESWRRPGWIPPTGLTAENR